MTVSNPKIHRLAHTFEAVEVAEQIAEVVSGESAVEWPGCSVAVDLRPRPMVIGYHSSDDDINDSIDCMASITIRDLDDTVKERLRRRAAAHGRSMEAEARAILSDSVRPTNILRDIYDATRELPDGPDLDIPEQEPARVIEL